ncbi:hypothetical protein V8F06_004512 [Rhypophila decipiens]
MAEYEGSSPTGVQVRQMSTGTSWQMERYLNYNPEMEDHESTMDFAILLMDWDLNGDDMATIEGGIRDLERMVEYLQRLEQPAKRVQEHIEEHMGNVNAWRRKAEGVLQALQDKIRPRNNKRKADQIEDDDEDSSDIDWSSVQFKRKADQIKEEDEDSGDLDSNDLDWDSIHDDDRSNIIEALGETYRPKYRNEKVMKAVRERIDIWNAMTTEVWEDRDIWVEKSDLASHRLNKKVLQKLYEMEYDARKRLGLFAVGNEEEMPQFMISDYEAVWARTKDSDDSD